MLSNQRWVNRFFSNKIYCQTNLSQKLGISIENSKESIVNDLRDKQTFIQHSINYE